MLRFSILFRIIWAQQIFHCILDHLRYPWNLKLQYNFFKNLLKTEKTSADFFLRLRFCLTRQSKLKVRENEVILLMILST